MDEEGVDSPLDIDFAVPLLHEAAESRFVGQLYEGVRVGRVW